MLLRRYAVFLCLWLAACGNAQDTANNATSTAGNEVNASVDKMRSLIAGPPKPEKGPKPQPRYCYRTLNDIICYSKPAPGQDERLVAYQDAEGNTGYTMPESPSPAQLRKEAPLPKTTIASSPEGLTPKKHLKEIVFDPAELEPRQLVPDKPQ